MSDGNERTRRASRDLRVLILDAAQRLFREKGYTGVSTREIAATASVTESVVFRHFKSKAELFDEAAMAPFADLIGDFMRRWTSVPSPHVDAVERAREYVTELYWLCVENRDVLRVLISHPPSATGEAGHQARSAISSHIEGLTATLEQYLADQGARMGDVGFDLRCTMALVMGSVMFERELFGDGKYAQSAMPELLLGYVLRASDYTPPPGAPPGLPRGAGSDNLRSETL